MDIFTKGAFWDYWKTGSDEIKPTYEKFPNIKKEYWNDKDETAKIFNIETNFFDCESPFCMAFNEFNYLLKVDPELFTYDIEGIENYDDYMNKFNDEFKQPWDKDDHEWYNDLMDGSLKDEALEQKAIYEESWGDAKQSMINFYGWLMKTFKNFHELDYGLLEKLQDYWWKVNEHECTLFAKWRNYIRGPYANYYSNFLDVMKHEEEERCEVFDDHKLPVCCIRRFKLVKNSFKDKEEYVAIKENEHVDLKNTSKDAIHAYQEIFRMMDEVWMVTHTK
uniref:Uncharacterized protein n=1 Tax=Tanacetum cinerariifolium TaxID=118510 RepID=A0A6L2LP67_TANCI|nr:hypothetical protein [Tanacetum cinerariifolium]